MTDTVIKVENLSKLYRLGEVGIPLHYTSALLCRSGYAKAMRGKSAPSITISIIGIINSVVNRAFARQKLQVRCLALATVALRGEIAMKAMGYYFLAYRNFSAGRYVTFLVKQKSK